VFYRSASNVDAFSDNLLGILPVNEPVELSPLGQGLVRRMIDGLAVLAGKLYDDGNNSTPSFKATTVLLRDNINCSCTDNGFGSVLKNLGDICLDICMNVLWVRALMY
jgi:hypothetical protein